MLHTNIAALAATVLAVAGCGGSSGSTDRQIAVQATGTTTATTASTHSGAPLTHAALVARANTICKRIVAKRETLTSHLRTQQDFTRQIPVLADYEQSAFTELANLTPPASLASAWREIARSARQLASQTATWGAYMRANRLKTAYQQIVPSIAKYGRELALAAKRDGIADCAKI